MTKPMTVFFATNRMPKGTSTNEIEDFGTDLGPYEGKSLRFGRATVDFEAERDSKPKFGVLEVEREELVALSNGSQPLLSSRTVFEALREALRQDNGCQNLLVVIHGFWNSFKESIEGAADLGRVLGMRHVFAFCWASVAKDLTDYFEDKKRAEISGLAICRAFEIFCRYMLEIKKVDRCEARINLLAHSMGNRALRHAVQAMTSVHAGRLPRVLNEVLSVAADEDAEAFERDDLLRPLCKVCRRVTVYHSWLDKAVQLGDMVSEADHHLGNRGPLTIRLTPDNVHAVDVSGVMIGDGDIFNHWYHRENGAVIADMKRALAGSDPDNGLKLVEMRRYQLIRP